MKKNLSILLGEFNFNTGEVAVNRVNISPFIYLFAAVKGIEVKDGINFPYLIKSVANKHTINKTITINNEEYVFYMSTTSQMKNSEGFFVKKEDLGTCRNIEHIASTGFITNLDGSEVCVNKDIIARLSLLFTGSHKTSIKPNVIILPDVEYSVFKNVKVFENNELVNKDNFKIDVTAFDGCGLMSNEIATRIGQELEMGYVPSFVTCRIPKMAVKGLLTNVDFIRYFNDTYVDDTETFKKIGQDFYIKDVFGNFIKVDENTIIINESMAKWSKYYSSMEEYSSKQITEYSDIMDCLYIAKYAKESAKEYTTTSYQSLCAMAITPQALERISKPVVDFYHRVLNGEKIAILEMLKLESSSENQEVKTTSDKISTLLSIDFDRFVKMPWVRKNLAVMIERKVKEVMTGTMPVKGNFKVAVADSIAFMNFAMTGKLITELKENEFYVKNELGKRAVMRYPVASPYELTNETLVANEKLDRYCNYTNEIIVFNQVGIDALIKSGEDFDGDTNQIIDNEDIINSIIPSDRIFVNTLDGGSSKQTYSWENRKKVNIEFAGNLIGAIAINSSTVGDKCLELIYLEDGKEISFNELKEKYNSDWEIINSKRIDNVLSEIELREYFVKQFKNNETKINKLVELSMISIDAPKTGVLPNKEELKNVKGELRKPAFFNFLPDKDYKREDCGYVNSVLSAQCGKVFNTLYKRVESISRGYKFYNTQDFREIFKQAFEFEKSERYSEVLNKLLNNYKLFQVKKQQIFNYNFNQSLLSEEEQESIKNDNFYKFKNLCLLHELDAEEALKGFEKEDVLIAIFEILQDDNLKSSNRYIFDFYFPVIIDMLELTNDTVTQLVQNENGSYKGMFKSYDLLLFKNKNMAKKVIKKQTFDTNRKLKEKVNVRFKVLKNVNISLNDEVQISGLNIVVNNEVIGDIFVDSLNKQSVSVADIQGIGKVLKFEVSQKGTSAKLILE